MCLQPMNHTASNPEAPGDQAVVEDGGSGQDETVGRDIQRGRAPSSCSRAVTTRRTAIKVRSSRFAYPVPESQEAPEPSVLPEVGESSHKASQNIPEPYVAAGEKQAARQKRGQGH